MATKKNETNRRPANKILDIANDIITRHETGNLDVTKPSLEECIDAMRRIEKIATEIRADTGTSDKNYKKKHRASKREINS
jgi:hypothetical protein